MKDLNNKLIIEKHIGVDIKEYFNQIYGYLKSQDNIDEDLLKKADSIYTFIDNLIRG